MTKIKREAFMQILDSVSPGLSPRDILEQSSCFVFSNGNVMTFNGEVSCRAKSGLDKEVSGAVSGKKLVDVLTKSPDEEIEIGSKEGKLTIKGFSRQSNVVMEADILLPVKSVEKPEKWLPLNPDFAEAVGIVSQCAPDDPQSFPLNCVHIMPEYVEAGHSYQIGRYNLDTGIKGEHLIRAIAIRSMSKMGHTEFSETDGWLHFRNASGLIMSCRKYLEEYDDFSGFLEQEEEGVPLALPKGLDKVAERAMVFSEDNPDLKLITVELKKGRMRITGRGITGEHIEMPKAVYAGPPMSFLIKPDLLAEITKKHNDCVLTGDKLRIDGGKWKILLCLTPTKEADDIREEKEGTKKRLENASKKDKKLVTVEDDE